MGMVLRADGPLLVATLRADAIDPFVGVDPSLEAVSCALAHDGGS